MQTYRTIDGILLLDKPVGLTSNRALQVAKGIFRAKKAGHSGSLDPLASGLLPICFGQATKFTQFVLEADKLYEVTLKLGERTDSGDADGKVIAQQDVPTYTEAELEETLEKFRGPQKQVPSMFSAIKYQGKPLYHYARKGMHIDRPPRSIHIYKLEMLNFEQNLLTLRVLCSKGTYIRNLADDLGVSLGCYAHVVALRRLGAGPYMEPKMFTLDDLRAIAEQDFTQLERLLLPMDSIVASYPEVSLTTSAAFYIRNGRKVLVPQAPIGKMVRLTAPDRCFIGIGQVQDDGHVAPHKLLAEDKRSA